MVKNAKDRGGEREVNSEEVKSEEVKRKVASGDFSFWRSVSNVNRIVYLPYNGFYDYFRIIKPQFL